MDITKRNFEVINEINEKIAIDLRLPEIISKPKPAIFILHGFKGWKEWAFLPFIAGRFAQNTIAITFSFSLSGMIEGSDWVEYPEKFARNTISQELKDLDTVINAFKNGHLLGRDELSRNWNGEIYLLGHSLGGGIAIVYASENKFVNKIAVWASVGKFDRYTERQKSLWKKSGFIEFTHSRTGQLLQMNLSYLEDLENNSERYNLTRAVTLLSCPMLIVHGNLDLTVPIDEAMQLEQVAGSKTQTYYLPKASHVFGVSHPMKLPSRALNNSLEKTMEFLNLR